MVKEYYIYTTDRQVIPANLTKEIIERWASSKGLVPIPNTDKWVNAAHITGISPVENTPF